MRCSEYGIPKKIKIGGVNYRIIFPYTFECSTSNAGIFDNEIGEIRIVGSDRDKPAPVERVHETLLHEVLHGIDRVYCGGALPHDTIYKLSMGWHQVFRDNDLLMHSDSLQVPKTIKIMGMEYKIKYPFGFIDSDDEWIAGQVLNYLLEMRISKRDNDDLVRASVIQCVTEAIVSTQNLDDKINEEENISGEMKSQVSHGLHQVIMDSGIDILMRTGGRGKKRNGKLGRTK
jgi:hypothetical protein